MNVFQRISLCLAFALLSLPAPGIAARGAAAVHEPPTNQEILPHNGATTSKQRTTEKPNQGDVQSRGLFQKKKKKQKGGSAGHSQPAEQADAPAP
jgi:hypothetical protein